MWFKKKNSNTDQLTWNTKDGLSAIYCTQRLSRKVVAKELKQVIKDHAVMKDFSNGGIKGVGGY